MDFSPLLIFAQEASKGDLRRDCQSFTIKDCFKAAPSSFLREVVLSCLVLCLVSFGFVDYGLLNQEANFTVDFRHLGLDLSACSTTGNPSFVAFNLLRLHGFTIIVHHDHHQRWLPFFISNLLLRHLVCDLVDYLLCPPHLFS